MVTTLALNLIRKILPFGECLDVFAYCFIYGFNSNVLILNDIMSGIGFAILTP